MSDKKNESQLVGGLPGTGGDFLDTEDVEGHGVKQDEPRVVNQDEPRVEKPSDEDDVEGHLYRGGPTTQGEVIRRGPGDNPHGER